LQPRIGNAQVLLVRHHPRQQARAGHVGERLGKPEGQQGQQDQRDVHGTADDRQRQRGQHRRPQQVDRGHDLSSVESVGYRTRRHAEQQVGQPGAEHRQRDEERVTCLRRHEQRAGGQGNAVADVVDDRCGEQPAKAAAEARRHRDVQKTHEARP
jgi:hypothetical protein